MSPTILAAVLLFSSTPVDFDTEVVPVLTRLGCNAGSCHGAAAGRGGFKLSLFGNGAEADYAAIVHELEGRRINLAQPFDSLVIAKPAGYIDHEGGVLLDEGGHAVEVLTRWITEGATRRRLRQLVELRVTPAQATGLAPGEKTSLRVEARFDDGTTRDVSSIALYSPVDPGSVNVGVDGMVDILRRGRHAVGVRFLDQMQTIELTVPVGDALTETRSPASHWIDQSLEKTLSELRIPISPLADDATQLRRLMLDLTGRLPTTQELDEYLQDTRADKYEQLVTRLLRSDGFVEYWTYRVARWLMLPDYAQQPDREAAPVYYEWLREQIRHDVAWNHVAGELVMATGDSHRYGPANFHRQSRDARGEAELFASMFLGAELRCANCHNHPLDRWTQDDYHGLAAIFARIERGRFVSINPRGEVTHPATGEPATPRLPGDRNLSSDQDPRRELSTWLTSSSNPYFAPAIVNRIWKELMGRGLVEPTDGFRLTNPPTHSDLLEQLATHFVANGFRLRQTVRSIVLSQAYRRSSQGVEGNRDDQRYYSHALVKPLTPEVYLDAVRDVLGAYEPASQRVPERFIRSLDAFSEAPDLASLNGCTPGRACEASDELSQDLATRLQLINGDLLNLKIVSSEWLASVQGDRAVQIVNELYRRALGRLPTEAEAAFWNDELAGTGADAAERLHDFAWSLLNCREFATNH